MEKNDDPFAALEQWAKETERRVRRETRRVRLLSRLKRKPAEPRDPHSTALHTVLRITVAVVGLAVLATAIPGVRAWLPLGNPAVAHEAYPTQSVPQGITVTTSESASTAVDPFAGTPAAAYPQGAAGITLPAAKAVPGFTEAQVRDSLAQVRTALIAGHLDNAMLVQHRTAGLIGLLAPGERDDVTKWFSTKKFTTTAIWIDPITQLDPAQKPRVSGRVTYSSTIIDGRQTLKITTNFVWVYAFTGVNAGWRKLAVAHDEIAWTFSWSKRLVAEDRGLWIASTNGYHAWVDCTSEAKGLLAPDRTMTPGAAPTENPDAYMRADHTLDIGDGCHLSTPAPLTS